MLQLVRIYRNLAHTAFVFAIAALLTSQLFGQNLALVDASQQQQLERIGSDKAGYVSAIVARWESAAREAGKWDEKL